MQENFNVIFLGKHDNEGCDGIFLGVKAYKEWLFNLK